MNAATSSPMRVRKLIEEIVFERLGFDLHGTTVVTEAATGPFALTASIAAMAGANVEAVAGDSTWGTSADAADATQEVARSCGVSDRIRIMDRRSTRFDRADVVTNLGFVRPLDAELISRLRSASVIPLMYDAREIRPGEIRLDRCQERRISVVGTNEDHPLVDVLRYSGHLAVKMLLEAGREILRNRICVVGENLFTPHVVRSLQVFGAEVLRCRDWRDCVDAGGPLDALVYLDYWNRSGQIDSTGSYDWLKLNSGTTLIQFVGGLDITLFKEAGWKIRPDSAVPPQRMWRTLADLGVRPLIELHAAGLKAAEMELKGVPHNAPGRLYGLRQVISPIYQGSPTPPALQTAQRTLA